MIAVGVAWLIIALIVLVRPRYFTFWCGRHGGTYTSRHCYPSGCPVCDGDAVEGCFKARQVTGGLYVCTRKPRHDGPCAALPIRRKS